MEGKKKIEGAGGDMWEEENGGEAEDGGRRSDRLFIGKVFQFDEQ